MTLATHATTSNARFEALKAKHTLLEHEIHEHQQHYASENIIKNLKRQKLKVKEEMENVRKSA